VTVKVLISEAEAKSGAETRSRGRLIDENVKVLISQAEAKSGVETRLYFRTLTGRAAAALPALSQALASIK
jgi:hypothetical protein